MDHCLPASVRSESVLKLKQGFDRLIRSRTDTGIVAILDSRVANKPYGRLFVESLPPCRVEMHDEWPDEDVAGHSPF